MTPTTSPRPASTRASIAHSIASIASFPEFAGDDDDDDNMSLASTRLVNRSRRDSIASEFSQGPFMEGDNSATVITSLWSTMMGSTVLVMPKMFRDAGLIGSVIALTFMCLLCSYTAVTITRLGVLHGMTTQEVVSTVPRVPRMITTMAAVLILVGAGMLFHVYIVGCVLSLIGKPESDAMWRCIVAIGSGIIVFLLTVPRSIKMLFIASSYGIVIVGFCLVFIIIKSALQFHAGDCTPVLSTRYGMDSGGFGPTATLMATLTLSFYSHSFVLPLVSQSTRASKIPRNVFIAYMCAGLSYAVPAAVATAAFSNCGTFAKDFVQMFHDPFADAARFSIILLCLIVYPIIICIARGQFVEAVFKVDPTEVSRLKHVASSGWMVLAATAIPCLDVGPTTVAATTGVFGTYWALLFPCAAYLHTRRAQGTLTPALLIGHGLIIALAVVLMVMTVLSVAGVIKGAKPPEIPPSAPLPTNHTTAPGSLQLPVFPAPLTTGLAKLSP
uniref:Amino acid transporter transmembrane domain-containing protein n=1 Tax=Neobodo designis TaxID=312471 RepID=A0A7S1MP92_NEODS|mmetsp:Transcript_44693/g.137906  ORF Transcript_44693/g.137906 Transcript_44693/m.137906 type:complete len:500 (+) Transcript_44693:294-1793(+)